MTGSRQSPHARALRGIPPRPIVPTAGGPLPYFTPRPYGRRAWVAVEDSLGCAVAKVLRVVGALVCMAALYLGALYFDDYEHHSRPGHVNEWRRGGMHELRRRRIVQ